MAVTLTPVSGYGNVVDLATASYVANVLAAGGTTPNAAQTVVLPSLITAASREIIRVCGRRFDSTVYDEIHAAEGTRQERGDAASFKLKGFPVQDVLRVATGRANVLTIQNTDTTTNQRAAVQFAFTGDVEWPGLQYTSLNLTRWASGVSTTVSVSFTTYPTIQAVATQVNTLGNGWKATVQPGSQPNYGLLPSSELVGVREPKNALGSGACLDVFGAVPNDYEIDRPTGIGYSYYGAGFGWLGGAGGGWDGCLAYGYSGGLWDWSCYRITYTQGFATIPESVQQVCAEVVQLMLNRLKIDGTKKTISGGNESENWSWTAKDAIPNLSPEARRTLMYYKDSFL